MAFKKLKETFYISQNLDNAQKSPVSKTSCDTSETSKKFIYESFSPLGAARVVGTYFAILDEHSLVYTPSSLGFQIACKPVLSCWDSHANKQLAVIL